jgi:hypothetical protein
LVALIIFILIIALGFCAFIIVFVVKLLKWFFSSLKSAPAANANPDINAITGSDEFNQFCSKRTEYWNKIIKEQKSRGVFDKNKKIYEAGEYKGVKYNIVSNSGSNAGAEDSEADLLIQIIVFSQF